MKQGAEVCVAATKALEEALEEGATEIDVAAAGEAVMEEEFKRRFPDFEYTGVLSVCRSGHRSIYGHTGPTGKRIQRGEVNLFGAEPEIMGYYYTLLRERVVGPVPEALKRPFDVRLEAAYRCLEAMTPGVKCSDIDKLARSIFEKAGYVQYKGFGTGHSFGLMGPFWGREGLGDLRAYNDAPIQEGTILSVEPS
ncbi:MAG: M24 family metallopeptidase, partial [Dehalococcoidia bacterium]